MPLCSSSFNTSIVRFTDAHYEICLGSARASRAGECVLAVANFTSTSPFQMGGDWKARPLLHPRYGGELGKGGLEIFDNGDRGSGRHGREARRVSDFTR